MDTSLKFFVVALCITKLIALVLVCWRGKGFVASFLNRSGFASPASPSDSAQNDAVVRRKEVSSVKGYDSTTRCRSSAPVQRKSWAPAASDIRSDEQVVTYFCQFTLYRKVARRTPRLPANERGAVTTEQHATEPNGAADLSSPGIAQR